MSAADRTQIFMDTEFCETGSHNPIRFISIGLVTLDGKEYYAEDMHLDKTFMSPWVANNVLPHIGNALKSREEIRKDLIEFIGPEKVDMWGYFADYDWVVFCQLFGRMMDLPEHFPKYCLDLRQMMHDMGVRRSDLPPNKGKKHSAIEDARWNVEVYKFLRQRRVDAD